ncbi:MAG: hypothetical protein L0Y58_05720 [Verrucomicrobia subdivision 3 bacterium]|nr:hypothetical protein [Limisphaerales bacterium]
MRSWQVPVRITRTFYMVVNGTRVHFKRKADAVSAVDTLLSMQRIQVLTVREYQVAHRARIKRALPPG